MQHPRPPSPPAHFLLGHLPDMRDNSLDYEKHLAKTYGDMVHIRFAYRHAYQVNHPDAVHQVLVEKGDKFYKAPIYKLLLSRFLGDGMLTSDGEFWKRQRKLSQPAFHHKRIQTYASVMVEYAERLVSEWQPGATRDISRDMMELTLSIVSKTLFNADIQGDADRIDKALTDILEATNEAAQSMIMAVPSWIPTKTNRRTNNAVKALDAIIMRIINERRASGEDTGDLLSMLLMARDDDGSSMSDKQVRDESVTLVLAGHETTANALTWAWFLLSQHPDIEAKLHEELDRVLGGRAPTLDDLRQLPYTDQVIKETLRLYPPIPTIARVALEDVEIGGYNVPKDMIILISSHAIHRDPRWYDNPDDFMPERWTKAFEKSLPKLAYMPFGGGARICIGNMFAEMEANLVLATIAQKFRPRMLPGQGCLPEATLTLRPRENLCMTVEAREPKATPPPAPLPEFREGELETT